MSKLRPLLPVLCAALFACNIGSIGSAPPAQTDSSGSVTSARRCGDGVCDGPETAGTCPEDCAGAEAATENAPAAGVLSPGTEASSFWMINPASGARLFITVSYPADGGDSPLPTVLMIPGGLGTRDPLNGADPDAIRLAAAGYVVIQFDADGRGSSGGAEDYNGFIHQDGLAALILAAGTLPRVDPARLGVISRSYGVSMAAGALGRHPDLPVRFYIDWEGPADRTYTTSGCTGVNHGIEWPSCGDETFWSQREAVAYIGAVRVPYLRIQSAKDHVQSTNSHAVDMVNAAVQGGVPWVRLNDGPVNQTYDPTHPPEMLPDEIDSRLSELFVRYAGELLAL
jgi:pimeloyl-ACP methyl ester carboxylesterase